jgi:hypothetical protein
MKRLLLSIVVLTMAAAGCASPHRSAASPRMGTVPTSTAALAAVQQPAGSTTTTTMPRGYEWVLLATETDADERDVLKALKLIKGHDPKRFQRMRTAVASASWNIFGCFTKPTCSDRNLGETQPTDDPSWLGCSTWIGFHFIKREAAAVRIPYLYFLAFVLVHEWVHCLPAGWNSEIPSLQAQVAFVQTWPEGAMRQRALWYARSLFSFVDENGHWIR